MEKRWRMDIIVGGMVLICLGVLVMLSDSGVFPFTKSWLSYLSSLAYVSLFNTLKILEVGSFSLQVLSFSFWKPWK